jgi:hypothetical protein
MALVFEQLLTLKNSNGGRQQCILKNIVENAVNSKIILRLLQQ